MRLSNVIGRFSLISGLDGEEVSRYAPLCSDAINLIKARVGMVEKLREENVCRLENCAAALAFYKYTLYAQEASVESFEAGAVKIKMDKTSMERARLILKEELRAAEDLVCLEDDFSFKGVRV